MTHKRKVKYEQLIIIYIAYTALWLILIPMVKAPQFPLNVDISLSEFVPAQDILTELATIFIIILPLTSIFSLLIGGYILTPIVIILHKLFFRSKIYYGIQYESHLESGSFLSLGFYPVLMSINLASIFNRPEIWGFILESNLIAEINVVWRIPALIRFFAMTILLMFTYGISIFLFSPVWYLRDSGIIYTNKRKIENSQESFHLKSLGDWFQTLLKSYAGIGAILNYIFIVYLIATNFINEWDFVVLILWFGLPFYLVLSMIPALIFNDLIRRHRINFTRKLAYKMGIKEKAIISFELKGIE
jgi:hypothetical protein